MTPPHLAYRWTYEVTPHRAFQIRNRLDFLAQKARQLDQHDPKVLELRERGGRFRCVTQMDIEVILPGWARPLFKPRNTITQYEIWRPAEVDGSRECDVTVEVDHVPVRVTGTGRLRPVSTDGCTVTGTEYQLELDVSSRMPIFGRRLQEFVSTHVARNAEGEGEFGHWWLANRETTSPTFAPLNWARLA
jgi:hypothetical protein